MHVDTTFIMDNAENMTAGDGEYISAPATVTFRAYANDPVATLYTWKIYRSDQENGIENPLVEYRDEEIDYTFTEKGDYTAVATVSNATGECEAVSILLKSRLQNRNCRSRTLSRQVRRPVLMMNFVSPTNHL